MKIPANNRKSLSNALKEVSLENNGMNDLNEEYCLELDDDTPNTDSIKAQKYSRVLTDETPFKVQSPFNKSN